LSVAFDIRNASSSLARWVKPEPVCRVGFVEWTDAGHLRHCQFVSMRDDKKRLK
jgi:ATP-dependent DNA ligase